MADQHTAKAFDVDLQDLARMVAEMGGLAEKQIAESVDALARRDSKLAQRVVALDPTVDNLQREIEERAILTIARRQPMAVDLREIVGALRVSNDLERIGDLAKNIAKRVIAGDGAVDTLQHEIEEKAVLTIARRQPMAIDLRDVVGALRVSNDLERIGDLAKNIAKRVAALNDEFHPQKLIRGVEHMSTIVLGQIKRVLDAYAGRDLQNALVVWKSDEEVDAMCTSLFRELLTYMMEDPRNITFCIHLMFCAKNIERMGDHATNIAETIYYMVEGHTITDQRPKGDTTAFASMKTS